MAQESTTNHDVREILLNPNLQASKSDQDESTALIRQHILHRSCYQIVPDEKKPGCCKCGYAEKDHIEEAQSQRLPSNIEWDVSKHTKLVGPSDAYGEIEFSKHFTTAKYIRVDSEMTFAEMHHIDTLLLKHWQLPQPNLIISVTGGSLSLHLNKNVIRKFRQGIVRASQSANAWIITGGTNGGVMRHTGKAVRDYAIRPVYQGGSKVSSRDVVCLGIANWGTLLNREQLINHSENSDKQERIVYETQTSKTRFGNFLDPNHTHFLLVDNGTNMQLGADNKFRPLLEKKLTERNGRQIPLCYVVLEGGSGTLKTVHEAILQKTPVVIVKNSGGIADVLAYAYQRAQEEEEEEVVNGKHRKIHTSRFSEDLRKSLRKMLSKETRDANKIEERLVKVEESVHTRDLITVLRLDTDNVTTDLQAAILDAFFKVSVNEKDFKAALRLSLQWNHADKAEEHVFAGGRRWPHGCFNEIVFEALVKNKVDFFKMFLRNCLSLKGFLGIHELVCLYHHVPPRSLLRQMLGHPIRTTDTKLRPINLRHIGELLTSIFKDSRPHPYCDPNDRYWWIDTKTLFSVARDCVQDQPRRLNSFDRRYSFFSINTIAINDDMRLRYEELLKGNHPRRRRSRHRDKESDESSAKLHHFDDPAFDLFLYCVLQSRTEMALVLFESLKEPIAAVLTAKMILKEFGRHARSAEEKKRLLAAETHFESRACRVLAKCFEENPKNAYLLLTRRVPSIGNRTCLEVARLAGAIEFISETCVQTYLNFVWFGKISGFDTTFRLLKVIASCFCPPILYSLNYDNIEDHPTGVVTDDSSEYIDPYYNEIGLQPTGEDDDNISERKRKLCCKLDQNTNYLKVVYFFNAPITIFIYTVLMHTIFLVVLAYDLLIQYNSHNFPFNDLADNGAELFLITYVASYALEEVRQAKTLHKSSIRLSLRFYFIDLWNLLDLAGITLFLAAMILGNITVAEENAQSVYSAGRVSYAIAIMCFYTKVLHWYIAFEQFGPKVYMVGRMLVELMAFWIIIMVFISSWGIAQWALLFPQSILHWSLLRDIFSISFWNIIGETNIETIQGYPFNIDDECTDNAELYSNFTLPRCLDPVGRTVAPMFLAIYIVLVDILLINLLIAIFTDVINNKQVTLSHWAFERFEQILEFRGKASLVPPFTIIYYFYWFVRLIFKSAYFRLKGKAPVNDDDFRVPLQVKLDKRYDSMLKAWMCEKRDEWVKGEEILSTVQAEYQLEKLREQQKEISSNILKLVAAQEKKKDKHKT